MEDPEVPVWEYEGRLAALELMCRSLLADASTRYEDRQAYLAKFEARLSRAIDAYRNDKFTPETDGKIRQQALFTVQTIVRTIG